MYVINNITHFKTPSHQTKQSNWSKSSRHRRHTASLQSLSPLYFPTGHFYFITPIHLVFCITHFLFEFLSNVFNPLNNFTHTWAVYSSHAYLKSHFFSSIKKIPHKTQQLQFLNSTLSKKTFNSFYSIYFVIWTPLLTPINN